MPVEVRPDRRKALAIRWLVGAARKRGENTMTEKLAAETDIAGYRTEFLKLFGFGLPGINYDAETEPHVPML